MHMYISKTAIKNIVRCYWHIEKKLAPKMTTDDKKMDFIVKQLTVIFLLYVQ